MKKSNIVKRNLLWIGISIGFTVASLFIRGIDIYKIKRARAADQKALNEIAMNPLLKVGVLVNSLNTSYVDSINSEELTTKTIRFVLSQLDPHSYYLEPKEFAKGQLEERGEWAGIEVGILLHNDTLRVTYVTPGSVSQQVGLQPFDCILAINDSTVVGPNNIQDMRELLCGKNGSDVRLLVKREGESAPFYLQTKRSITYNVSIESTYVDRGIGYLKLSSFNPTTTFSGFIHHVMLMQEDGAKSLVIDLRDNLGGDLQTAMRLLDQFVEEGSLLGYYEGRHFRRKEILASDSGRLRHLPLAVLINEQTASASELFAGTIQDNDRGIIIGRRSFGKAIGQSSLNYKDGSAVKLTTIRVYTSLGRSIQKPYEMGQSTAYFERYANEMSNGELLQQGSLLIDSTQIFHSKGGRPLYGGGGIVPDIFIPTDSAHNTNYWKMLLEKELPQQYAFEWLMKQQQIVLQYPDCIAFIAGIDHTSFFPHFTAYAAAHGVRATNHPQQQVQHAIDVLIKSYLAYYLFGLNGYYQVTNYYDLAYREAHQVLLQHMDAPYFIANSMEHINQAR